VTSRLTVIIVNHNGAATLPDCLQALLPALSTDDEVIVVDNASSDGSTLGLEDGQAGVRVIRNLANLGFAAAVNQGLGAARGRLLLLLNPDCVIANDALTVAVDYLDANPDVGVLGGRVLRPDGRLDPPARRSFKTPATYFYKMLGLAALFPRSRRFGRYYLGFLDEAEITDVDAVVGAFLMIRAATVAAIGPLDERFFMYCEDEDWCWRVKQSGARVVYHPGVVVKHEKGASTRRRPFLMAWHFHRSLLLFHRKNIAPRYPLPVNLAVYCGIGAGLLGAVTIRLVRGVARVPARP